VVDEKTDDGCPPWLVFSPASDYLKYTRISGV
jgi:hypothetical protein